MTRETEGLERGSMARGSRWPRLQEAGLVLVIVLIGLILSFTVPPVRGENGFLRLNNLIPSVLTPMSWMAIMAVGVTCVVISGGIDISVGSIFGLSALGTVAVLQNFDEGASAWVVIPTAFGVALGIGGACGLINGVLVYFRMHPFIVTLATMSIFRGIVLATTEGVGSLPSGDKNLPEAFTNRFISWSWTYDTHDRSGQAHAVMLQPVPMLVMLVCVGLGWMFLRYMVPGRETYAVGGNEEAARFSGLPVGWVKVRVYVISGLLCGVAGLVTAGFYKSAATNTGQGYELAVVAAVVVGGASLSGGRGTALGALLGAMVMQLIENGISLLGYEKYSQIVVGLAILVAVAVDRVSTWAGTGGWRRK